MKLYNVISSYFLETLVLVGAFVIGAWLVFAG